jgi:transketolase
MRQVKELEKIATAIRLTVLQSIVSAGGGHTGGSLSSVDILVALYFQIMRIDPKHPEWEERDRFILSKGHSVESYHAVLFQRGFFNREVLDSYGRFNSILAGHPTRKVPGIELNSGALGHGLSVGVGLALAAKRSDAAFTTYVLTGDGEHGEGSLMEAAAAAGHYKLDNLVSIIDRNGLQISGPTEDVMAIENLEAKYRACGWSVRNCDGNQMRSLIETLDAAPFETAKPSLIIAHTTKGKGVSFMENRANWHHKVPSEVELKQAMKELNQ